MEFKRNRDRSIPSPPCFALSVQLNTGSYHMIPYPPCAQPPLPLPLHGRKKA